MPPALRPIVLKNEFIATIATLPCFTYCPFGRTPAVTVILSFMYFSPATCRTIKTLTDGVFIAVPVFFYYHF
jgi:hypothetical protein